MNGLRNGDGLTLTDIGVFVLTVEYDCYEDDMHLGDCITDRMR